MRDRAASAGPRAPATGLPRGAGGGCVTVRCQQTEAACWRGEVREHTAQLSSAMS